MGGAGGAFEAGNPQGNSGATGGRDGSAGMSGGSAGMSGGSGGTPISAPPSGASRLPRHEGL